MEANGIFHPLHLISDHVELHPLSVEHFTELSIAAANKKIWEFLSMDCSTKEKFWAAYESALEERNKGTQYPFVVYHKETGRLVGSTRFLNIDTKNRKLEIGWTWLIPEVWATNINFECKFLLMTHAFEFFRAIRVQLLTSDKNLRSRSAIQKIGGKFEGILRNERIRENGKPRNSAFYSILDTEWEEARSQILNQMTERAARFHVSCLHP